MSTDCSPAALDELLSEHSKARETLVEALTAAATEGDHGTVSGLSARLKRADALKNELVRLQREWQAIFHSETTEAEPLQTTLADNHENNEVPDQYDLCSPTLQALRTLGGKGRIQEIVETVIDQMNFTEEVTQQLHEGGPKTELEWQMGWSRTILKTCGFVDNPRSGVWALTESGSIQQWMDAAEIKALYQKRLAQRRQSKRN